MVIFFIIVSFIVFNNFQLNNCTETPANEWKEKIIEKLVNVFINDAETFSRIMFFLDWEEKEYQGETSPLWRTLKCSMRKDELFTQYAKRISEDTKRAENDVSFKKTLSLIYDNMLEVSEKQTDVADFQNFNMENFLKKSAIEKAGLMGFATAWTMIPATGQKEIMRYILTVVKHKAVANFVGLVNHVGGEVMFTALAGVTLTYDTIKAIFRWWNGEISGVRCTKIIVDSFSITAGGIAGGAAGAIAGAAFGPIGIMAGGVAGGILGGHAAMVLSDRMTQWMFSIPREEALENAFRYFHLHASASNVMINAAYRQMCLKHHPDRGGKAEDFHYVQVNMAIIKAAKENN